jgi:hypothetical protein
MPDKISEQELEQKLLSTALFHGTQMRIERPEARSLPGILWTAETPAIAQSYIPECGLTQIFSEIENYEKSNLFPPNKGIHQVILNQLGARIEDISFDAQGCAVAFSILGNPIRYQSVENYLTTLGYVPQQGRYRLKIGFRKNGEQCLLPAEYKTRGRLFILLGKENLNLFDMSRGESDLGNLQYNRTGLFQQLIDKGYDGVIIDDFAQSRTWGNIDHKSIGLFKAGLEKMKIARTPASNFDWQDEIRIKTTLEFRQFIGRLYQKQPCHRKNKTAPEDILNQL